VTTQYRTSGKAKLTNHFIVLTIPTAVLGIFTALAIVERIWKLTKKDGEFRPINGSRFGLDIFQWGYFLALLLISALISTALARGDIDQDNHELQTRLVSLPAALLMFILATLTLLSLILNWTSIKIPFRLGSIAQDEVVKPAIYYIISDVVAVDGNGGLAYRQALLERYESSEVFRGMIWTLSVVWMLAFYVLAGIFAGLVWYLPVVAVYAVGWAGPFPVAGLLAGWTIWYVRGVLRVERREEEGQGEGQTERRNGGGEGERAPLLGNRV
jgi:hypothetical protein